MFSLVKKNTPTWQNTRGGYYFLKDKLIQDNYIKANIKNL